MSIKSEELPLRFGLQTLSGRPETKQSPAPALSSPYLAAPSIGPPPLSTPARAQRPADTVLGTIGRLIVAALTKTGDAGNVFGLLDKLEPMTVQELLPAVSWLEDNRYVQVQDRQRTGDWKLALTPEAKTLL